MSGRWARLRDLLLRRRAERDTDEEFRFHIEMETEKNERAGMSPAEARRVALARFGGVERHKEELREGRVAPVVEPILRDLRFALRGIRRSPAFSAVSVLTIALGVGATATVFSIANTLLIRPPSLPGSDGLVTVDENRRGAMSSGIEGWRIPFPRYQAYAEGTADVFTGLAARTFTRFALRLPDQTVSVSGARTSGNYFQVLGIVPEVGSFYGRDDDPRVVISHRLWRERFGEDPDVVGRTIHLDGRPLTIAGVAPSGFSGATVAVNNDVWVPVGADGAPVRAGDWTSWVAMLGRLRPGVDRRSAEAATTRVALAVPPDESQTTVRGTWVATLSGLPRNGRPVVAGFLAMLMGMAALVLLIASANIAGMLSARTFARRRELAVRLSLGAGRGRLVRHLAAEGGVLFALGGATGVALAYLGAELVSRIPLPTQVDVSLDAPPDGNVLVFALLATGVVGMVFTLLPALQASRPDLVPALKEGGRRGPSAGGRMRAWFVGGQVAMAALLLVVAMLFVRSLRAALDVDLGFDYRGVAVSSTDLGPHGYDAERGRAFYAQLTDAVRGIPGVESVALTQMVPLNGDRWGTDMSNGVEGEDRRATNVSLGVVDPAYFETMRVELVAGRALTEADVEGSPPVLVINRTLAERLWPGENAVGRPIHGLGTPTEVVGVARDGKYTFLAEGPTAFAFLAFGQHYRPDMSVVARAPGAEAAVLRGLADEVRRLDANVAVELALPMSDLVGSSLFPQRFAAGLIGIFGVIGLLLAALGVYGVLAFQVAQRTRELGIRRALGARGADLIRQVVGSGAWMATLGCAIGLVGGGLVARLIQSLLVGLRAIDAFTFVTVPVVLVSVAVVASLIPALRATSVEATEALRSE